MKLRHKGTNKWNPITNNEPINHIPDIYIYIYIFFNYFFRYLKL